MSSIDALTDGGSKLYILSAAARERSDFGARFVLTTYNIRDIIDSFRKPQGPLDAIDRLLVWVHDRIDSPADYVTVNPGRDYSVIAAKDSAEFAFYLQKARALAYIERPSGEKIRLDLRGWERLSELRRSQVVSDQAFVAMWFHSSMTGAWEAGIKPALTEIGYRPLRVDQVEHNEKIDDLIIAEIRRSSLLVADFTGHNAGVYFEAGFAMGLGITVIRTCRKSDIGQSHFDTRQYNHVVWSDPADLATKLRRRIEATIPYRPVGNRLDPSRPGA